MTKQDNKHLTMNEKKTKWIDCDCSIGVDHYLSKTEIDNPKVEEFSPDEGEEV